MSLPDLPNITERLFCRLGDERRCNLPWRWAWRMNAEEVLWQIELREEVQPRRHRDGFGAPAHAQLAIDTADLGLNGVGRDDQHLRYLRIGLPGTQPLQDLEFLDREGFEEHGGTVFLGEGRPGRRGWARLGLCRVEIAPFFPLE